MKNHAVRQFGSSRLTAWLVVARLLYTLFGLAGLREDTFDNIRIDILGC